MKKNDIEINDSLAVNLALGGFLKKMNINIKIQNINKIIHPKNKA